MHRCLVVGMVVLSLLSMGFRSPVPTLVSPPPPIAVSHFMLPIPPLEYAAIPAGMSPWQAESYVQMLYARQAAPILSALRQAGAAGEIVDDTRLRVEGDAAALDAVVAQFDLEEQAAGQIPACALQATTDLARTCKTCLG